MLRYTRTAIGLLTRQYRSVLRKCWLINVGLYALGAAAVMAPSEAKAGMLCYNSSGDVQYTTGTSCPANYSRLMVLGVVDSSFSAGNSTKLALGEGTVVGYWYSTAIGSESDAGEHSTAVGLPMFIG